MNDVSKHLILLYFISFLSGIACISILFVICKKGRTILFNSMRNFNVAFTIYILMGFADYYRTFFFLKWKMNILLMCLSDVSLIIFLYYWLLLSQVTIGIQNSKWIRILKIESILTLGAWFFIYLFYMDKEYNIDSGIVKFLGILTDTVFYATLIRFGLFYIVTACRNINDKLKRNYFLAINVMILFYICWEYLDDFTLVFYSIEVKMSDIYPFNPIIPIYLAFNIWTIIYLYNNAFIEISNKNLETAFSDSDSGLYSIDELAQKFNLTKREKEMVQLVYKGHSNPEISQILNISTGTVKRHIQNIFRKMNIKNRYELIYLIKSK